MLATVMTWEAAEMRAAAGRDATWFVLAVFPALLLLPLTAGAFFTEWLQGAMVLGWVYAFIAAGKCGARSGRLEESCLWVFQKGHGLADYSLARLIYAVSSTAALVSYVSLWYVIAAIVHSQFSLTHVLAFIATLSIVALIALAILYLAGALRAERGTDFLIVIAIVSLLQDVLASSLPEWSARVIAVVLPPFKAASPLVGSVAAGHPADALGAALHIIAFIGGCVSLAAFLHARWRPRLASSA